MDFPYAVIVNLKQKLQAIADMHVALRKMIFQDAQQGFPASVWNPDFIAQVNHHAPPWSLSANFNRTQYLEHAKAIQGIEQIWFEDIQDKRETLTYPGLVACSAATFQQLLQLNQLRSDFKQYVVDIKKTHTRLKDLDIEARLNEIGWFKRDKIVREAFRQAGISRLCLKQIYRNVPLWDSGNQGELLSAQFYQKFKRPILKTSVKAQRVALEKKRATQNTAALERAYAVLERLPDDLAIAQIKNPCRIITANLKFKAPEQAQQSRADGTSKTVVSRKQLPSVLPIFYLCHEIKHLIPHDFAGLLDAPAPRAKRSDSKIEEEPFLAALHLYHYRK